MKIKLGRTTIVTVAAVCVTLPALAQRQGTNLDNAPSTNYNGTSASNLSSRDRDEYDDRGSHQLGTLVKAKDVLGAEVKDSQNNRLAKVKDLAIDLQNGRIVEVIVATGGVLGMDESFVAVPPSQFTYDDSTKTLQLRADKTQLQSAPSFKMSDWEQNIRQAKVEEVYQYYSAKPYFTSDDNQITRNSNRTPSQLGQVERASKLIGTVVHNTQDERLGKVENLMVSLPSGRVAEVIIASGGFLGMGDELSAIPPQAFHYGSRPDTLTLDTTKQALNQAPHFKSADWENANSPDQVSTVYRSYNVQPYFSTGAAPDNTAQNVRDRDTNSMTPFKQGNSQADIDITREIRRQVTSASNLSVSAHNVKIITVNGHVTLRGPVANDQEKQVISDIANRVATPNNVDNEIQIMNSNDSTANPNPMNNNSSTPNDTTTHNQ